MHMHMHMYNLYISPPNGSLHVRNLPLGVEVKGDAHNLVAFKFAYIQYAGWVVP